MRSQLATIAEMIAELESTSSKNDKQAILKRYDSDYVQIFLNYALDPYKKYFVRKIPRHTPAAVSAVQFGAVLDVLDDLCRRAVTGNEAIDLVQMLLNGLDVREGDVFQRMLTKDLKCGTNVATVNKAFAGLNLIPEFDVQLAAQWDGDKITWPRLAEPKIDGMRCLAFVEGPNPEDVVFMSRKGKPIETMIEVAESIVAEFSVGTVLDGEAKNRFGSFEDSMSIVKRKTARDDADIVFYVFDCLTTEEFAQQSSLVGYRERRGRFIPQIVAAHISERADNLEVFAEPDLVSDLDEAGRSYARARADNFEGLILKEPDGKYDFKRSRTWMKMKPHETKDVEIVGYEEGKKGKRIGKLGAFQVLIDGETCRVGGGYSDEQLVQFWENRDKMIGDLIEVEFMEKTAKGKTRHCNFIRLRTFKGEKC